MSDEQKDRRVRRSDDPDQAIQYQLDHAAERLDLRALVLADDFGAQLAAVGDRDLNEVLSALAMWAEFNGGSVDEFTMESLRDHDPAVEADQVVTIPVAAPGDAARMQLIALGRSIVASIEVARAAEGIERIRAKAAN